MEGFRLEWLNEAHITVTSPGTTILQAQIDAGLPANAPCGGNGSCGKCKVEIRTGTDQPWEWVRACRYTVESDLQIRTHTEQDIRILTGSSAKQTASEQADAGAQKADSYAVAFDIGTTSIVGYLLSGDGQREIAAQGRLNPQVKFGADVISRLGYATEHGPQALSDCVREALNGLITQLCSRAEISRDAVRRISIVGNTCMHHLFLGVSPESLGRAPYSPAVSGAMILKAGEYGLEIHPEGVIYMLPVIAGFVGSDTVACMLADDWQKREKLGLIIDIGTNGELVMGNAQSMIACSTAAGPAFEGAKIQCGMRGTEGAVDRVWLRDGKIEYHVIGETRPRGICGSGIVDLMAVLLEAGIVDETGRMEQSEYTLAEDVVFTQKDVREVQLAKAAISAGITLMARKLGISLEDILEVRIAGAFGNYMNAENACKIGMIPMELLPGIKGVGNAAGEGAKRALAKTYWDTACALAQQTQFLELASIADFQDAFVDALEFPEE